MSQLCRFVPILCFVMTSSLGLAQQVGKPKPTLANVPYGEHERQVLDFWQAESGEPAPFVIYIHGGGFAAGSKENFKRATLRELLDAGISVVAVNYRYYHQAPLPAALHDCRRALQFVRSKADDWNLDKHRAGATGGSAGAIASMYLAFHDEMADPDSSDPVERESTRLTCVATTSGQTTLDTQWWVTHVPGWPKDEVVKRDGHAYKRWGIDKADFANVIEDASALSNISPDDPPIWMSYGMAPNSPEPKDPKASLNWKVHHVAFGVALKEQADAIGVEAYLKYPGTKPTYSGLTNFMIAKLNAPPPEISDAAKLPFELYWSRMEKNAKLLPSERTTLLNEAAERIADYRSSRPLVLSFICTHNSRRSQLAQTFAHIAAERLDLQNIECVSGGTEVTACNPRIIATLTRCGLAVQTKEPDSSNPKYVIATDKLDAPITLYSKRYDNATLEEPTVAMMCCSAADEACPVIKGAIGRFPLHYEDPKASDNTPSEAAMYDTRRDQIAAEMIYLMTTVNKHVAAES